MPDLERVNQMIHCLSLLRQGAIAYLEATAERPLNKQHQELRCFAQELLAKIDYDCAAGDRLTE